MKKTLFIAAVLFVTTLTSCSPYLIDRIFDVAKEYKTIKAKDMPDFNAEHTWVEKTKEQAVEIWKNYPDVTAAKYTKLDFYEHTSENGKEFYSLWKDCAIEGWKNNYYENLPWNTIYTSYTAAKDYELNAESPKTVADSVKIFMAEDDSSFTKFEFDSSAEKGLRIYQNGWLVYEKYYHYFENSSGDYKGYDVHSAIVYKK